MKKIIFATTNQGKVREVKMMMEDFGVDFVTMKDMKRGYRIYVGWKTKGSNI